MLSKTIALKKLIDELEKVEMETFRRMLILHLLNKISGMNVFTIFLENQGVSDTELVSDQPNDQ